jgi:hypothetical protein
MTEKNLKDMEDGHTAGVIHGLFADFLQQQAVLTVSKMIASYRSNTLDHDKLVGFVGELACIDNIVNELENRQRRGFTAREKELK